MNGILPFLLRLINIDAHCPALIRAKSLYSILIKSCRLNRLTLLSPCKHCKSSRTIAIGWFPSVNASKSKLRLDVHLKKIYCIDKALLSQSFQIDSKCCRAESFEACMLPMGTILNVQIIALLFPFTVQKYIYSPVSKVRAEA